jgi:hypothetical protein
MTHVLHVIIRRFDVGEVAGVDVRVEYLRVIAGLCSREAGGDPPMRVSKGSYAT